MKKSIENLDFVCPDCGEVFHSRLSLGAHKGWHKRDIKGWHKRDIKESFDTRHSDKIPDKEYEPIPEKTDYVKKLENDLRRSRQRLETIYRTPRVKFTELHDIMSMAELDAEDLINEFIGDTNSQYDIEKGLKMLAVYQTTFNKKMNNLVHQYQEYVKIDKGSKTRGETQVWSLNLNTPMMY